MTGRRRTAEDWAAKIREVIQAAEADGYEVWGDVDIEWGDPCNNRIMISTAEPSGRETWIWGHKP